MTVGENQFHMSGRSCVYVERRTQIVGGRSCPDQRKISSNVHETAQTEAEKPAFAVKRESGVGDVVAGMEIAKGIFSPFVRPFDRTRGRPGGEQRRRIPWIDVRLETSAHIGRDHPNPGLADCTTRNDLARDPRVLHRSAQRVTVASSAENRCAAARLHCVAKNAVQAGTAFDGTFRLEERLVGGLPIAGLVNRRFVVPGPKGAVRKRSGHVRAGRQRCIAYFDRLGHVPRLDCCLNDHKRDVLADHAHGVDGPEVRHGRSAPSLRRRPDIGNGSPASIDVVASGNGRDRPGKRLRHKRIDRANLGAGAWRARHVALAMRVSVFEKIAAARKQPLVLEADRRPARVVFAHDCSPVAE